MATKIVWFAATVWLTADISAPLTNEQVADMTQIPKPLN